jgi:tripartite-type tricarboxylate transporter receptor subunit TctC
VDKMLLRTCRVLVGVTLLAYACPLLAQNYPSKPIRFIIPFPPGGGTDILARIVSNKTGENLGQSLVMDNRPGAGANIGAEIAARSAPDGYTLLMGNVAHAINMSLYKKLPYNFERDFAAVGMLALAPNILVVHPSLPANSVKELIALAKAKPGSINYGSSGSGSSAHLAAELFKNLAAVDFVHVPYKGGGPAVAALLGGEVLLVFATLPSALPQVKAGRLRALGLTSAQRSPALPDMPTIAEAGVPGYEATGWYGVLVPSGTPPAIIGRLNAEFDKAMQSAETRERLAANGYDSASGTPAQFGQYIKAEIVKWAGVVKSAKLQAD